MAIQKVNNKDFASIVELLSNRRKHIKYSFQELGYMLASKLNDLSHKPLYFRLAKYENRELLMKAFMFVIDSKQVNKGPLFMWKLKELKKSHKFRTFVGLFIENISQVNREIDNIQCGSCFEALRNSKFFIPLKDWHITLAFWDSLPGIAYPSLTRLVEKFYLEFFQNKPYEILLNRLIYRSIGERNYIFIDKFNQDVKILYQQLSSVIKSYKGKNKQFLIKAFQNKRFYPHITVARLKNASMQFNTCNCSINIKAQMKPFVVISILTEAGPTYKIHTII